jgi:dihydropyrimidinase
MVEALAESPARRFGLYPRKGNLQRGADADVVIFDPDEEWTISAAGLHTAADFTPYQGWRIKGRVTGVLLRGEALLEDGKLAKTPGVGQFLPQQPLT